MFRRSFFGLLLLAAIVLSALNTLPPKALPVDAPADQFSAERAAETLRVIARSPRLVGSPTFEMARTYLLDRLARLGLTVTTQDLSLEGVQVENTLGRLEGSSSREAILLVAHLDSVPGGPGAMDDASGVAEVLEVVRALRSGSPLENSIIVLFTAPEEYCCLGARAFATKHPWARDVRLVINTDAGGISGPSILAATGPNEGWLIRQMADVLPDPIASSAIEAFADPATDYASELRKYEWPGLDFNLSWIKRIHTPQDNIENIRLDSIQHQGEHLLAVTWHFGNLPLDFPREPNPIYFDLLGILLIDYPVSWAIPLFGLLSVGIGLAFWRIFGLRRPNGWSMALGALAPILAAATVPLLLLALQKWVIEPMADRSAGLRQSLVGESSLSNSIRWGSAFLAVLAFAFWYWMAFRTAGRSGKDSRADVVLGTTLLLYVLAGATLLFFPAVSYLLVWPLFYLEVAWLIHISKRRWAAWVLSWGTFLGWTATALVAIVLFVPGVLIALLSVSIQSIYLLPVFVVVLAAFLAGPILMISGATPVETQYKTY